MNELTDKIAATHRVRVFQFASDLLECRCGAVFPIDPAHSPEEARLRHVAEVTEAAVRAQIAADIRAWVAEQEDGVLTSGPHSSGVRYAAAACEGIAEGSAY